MYTVIYEKENLPWHYHSRGSREFRQLRKEAADNGELRQWDAANTFGPLGPGVYMAGESHPEGERPLYLSATGDPYFAFNFRQNRNFPLPPFEEEKYYKDCSLTENMVAFLMERLKCFGVREAFVDEMESYIMSSTVEASSNLGSLNEWLFFDTSAQLPPNYNTILRHITKYTYNVLGLWNGKSSHLFVDYDTTDFDFAKTTLEGDSKVALYEAARVIKRFVPAHAIPRININASANEDITYSGTDWDYVSLDHGDEGFSHLQTCSVLAGYECSGVSMGGPPGSHSGRNQFNTFQRDAVDAFADPLISSSTVTTAAPRKALRRRNYRFTLPEDGYYDRAGFNGPTNWDASTMEFGLRGRGEPASGLGELTLGYLYSANAFYPVHDTANLSGVWHQCEDLGSPRTFSGAPTARTYPYRGLSSSPLLGVGEERWTSLQYYRSIDPTDAAYTKGRWKLNDTSDNTAATRLYFGTKGLGWGQSGFSNTPILDTAVSANQSDSVWCPKNLASGDKIALVQTGSDDSANVGKRLVYNVTGAVTVNKTSHGSPQLANGAFYYTVPISYAYGDGAVLDDDDGADYVEIFSITTEGGQAHHQDRGQLPPIYATMHKLYERQALEMAKNLMLSDPSAYSASSNWYNCAQSLANSGIASGYVGDTFDIYRDFKFGRGLHKTFADYCYYFNRHDLGRNEMFNTGPNIFAHIFDRALYNCDFSVEGSAVSTTLSGSFIASSIAIDNPISWNNGSGVFSTCAVNTYSTGAKNLPASGTYIASSIEEMVLPMSGTFTPGKPLNAEYRNPKILSGIEFVQTSGAPSANEFRIFKLDPSFAVAGEDNFLIDNVVIKQKSSGGLPRIRFDLSSYGPRRNYLVPDHKFSLNISALVGEENRLRLGGETMGVWIHTNCTSGWMWSFVPNDSKYVSNDNRLADGRWIYHKEGDLSIREVTQNLAFKHTFEVKERTRNSDYRRCLGNIDDYGSRQVNNGSLLNLISSDFTNFNIQFDTRNYSIYNNMEYSEVIPVPEEVYKSKDNVHTSATNYYVEIFLMPTVDDSKYLLIEDIKLQDVTQRENAGIGTGYGIETKGTPLRPFVKEDKLELDKDEMQSVLKFFTGLMGSGVGVYATNYAARDKALTASVMERDGGGRLNYRLNPLWNVYEQAAAPAGSTPSTNQLITLEVVN